MPFPQQVLFPVASFDQAYADTSRKFGGTVQVDPTLSQQNTQQLVKDNQFNAIVAQEELEDAIPEVTDLLEKMGGLVTN